MFSPLVVFDYTPLITWKEFQACMPWEIAILVGGGFALADGCEVMSGLFAMESGLDAPRDSSTGHIPRTKKEAT